MCQGRCSYRESPLSLLGTLDCSCRTIAGVSGTRDSDRAYRRVSWTVWDVCKEESVYDSGFRNAASIVRGRKAGTDLTRASGPDTAVLLLQLVAIIFFMEASRVVLSFDREMGELAGRTDDMSQAVRGRLAMWVAGQLSRQARLMIGALGLSLVLVVLGGLTSVSINQPALSAILVLLVVGALLFLITQRREPETRKR